MYLSLFIVYFETILLDLKNKCIKKIYSLKRNLYERGRAFGPVGAVKADWLDVIIFQKYREPQNIRDDLGHVADDFLRWSPQL